MRQAHECAIAYRKKKMDSAETCWTKPSSPSELASKQTDAVSHLLLQRIRGGAVGDPERRMLQLLELEEESTSRSRQKPYWRPPANEKLLSVNESLGKKKIKNASRVVAASVCAVCAWRAWTARASLADQIIGPKLIMSS